MDSRKLQALVDFIGSKTGLEVDRNIIQTNVVGQYQRRSKRQALQSCGFQGRGTKRSVIHIVEDMVTYGWNMRRYAALH